MATRISSSKFLESTVAKNAALKGIDDPVYAGGGPLPPGIRDGVAKLKEIYFDADDKYGESFRAEAEVVLPDSFNGRYIKGKLTKQWITFNADNLDERVPRIRDIIKGLGGRGIFGDGKNVNFFQIVEFLNKANKTKPIYFSFSTTAKDTGEWPWENWGPAIQNFKEPGSTPVVSPIEIQKKTEYNNGTGRMSGTMHIVDHDPALWSTTPTPIDTYSDDNDLSSVIKRAVAKDDSAIDKLEEWAKDLGYTQDDLDESPSYETVGEWIKVGKRKEELDNPTRISPTKPKRTISEGQVYSYAPVNKKDDTKRLKERECRVMKVDNVREVATLQGLVNKSEVYEVSWGDENLK